MGKTVKAVKTAKSKKIVGKRIMNKIIQDATGQEIEFPEVENNEAVTVGDKATIDSKPAVGEFIMPDGSVYTFSSGILMNIEPPTADSIAALSRSNSLKGCKEYITGKRNKVNPTATSENRFAGIPERIKTLKSK